MSLTDPRAQISSMQWQDRTGTYHSTNISGGDTRVTLPRYGDGQSNYNIVKIDITSEAGNDSQTYEFEITRKADTTAPSLESAIVDGTSLALTYNEGLDESSTPHPTDFAVTVVDSVISVGVSNVTVDGMKVVLTLDENARFGDTVTLSYTRGDNPIEDPAQNPAVDLSDHPITNETAKATTNTLETLSLGGLTLDQTFSPNTVNYTASAPHETGETTVTATPTDPRATATIASTDPDDNVSTGHEVILKAGNTVVTVAVTPEDTSAPQKVYTVTVTRLQDTTAPALVSATVDGSALSLAYDEILDQDSVPGNGAFSTTVNGNERTASAVSVVGSAVVLTLASAAEHGDAVNLDYTVPTGEDAEPIRDTAGNPAPSITDGPVDNQTHDTTPPEHDRAFVEGAKLTLAYDESLDQDSTPAAGSFAIAVNGITRDVANVSITGSLVTLTVNPAVEHGDSVTLIYAPPTGPDANPLQDIEGNLAAAIAGLSVDNKTPDTTPPRVVSMSVDGPALTMTYDEPLDHDSKPQTGAFTIEVNESAHSVSAVSIAGLVVTLTLDPTVEHGDIIILAYTVPTGESAKPIMDIAGNPATAIEDGQVQNDTPDTTPPELVSASVNSNTLTLLFNEELDQNSIPAPSDFTISITDSATNFPPSVAVTKVAILGNAVTLTLDYQARFGDTVSLIYTRGGNPIQDTAESQVAHVGSAALPYVVTNSTAKSEETGIESVTFESIVSDTTYEVPKADIGKVLTVKHADERLDVTVNLTDTRAQVNSIQWRDKAGDYQSTNLKEGNTRVTLPIHGEGPSSYNKVKIEVESESGDAAHVHNFNIIRESKTTAPKSENTAPRLATSTVNGAMLTMVFDKILDPYSIPEPEAFDVVVNGEALTVSTVTIAGADIVLTLAPPAEHGDTVVLTYTVPTGKGANPIRDLSGEIALAIRTGSVENQTPDTTSPALSSASVDGFTLTLTFNENLDVLSTPLHDDFNISVTDSVTDSQSVATVSKIVVSDSNVTLTLRYEVRYADTVTMVYIAGLNPIRDTAGNSVSDIGTEQTPRPVDNPTMKSTLAGYASVIFRSINSNRVYEVTEAGSNEFTVKNEDEYLNVEVDHLDRRGRTKSIEWFDISANGFKNDGNTVRLRLQGTGSSNRNRVRISLLSEADGESVSYEFQVTRQIDVTPPEFLGATVTRNTLTLTYNGTLNQASIPAGSDFSVTVVDSVTGESSTPSVSAVKVEDSSVILTLDTPPRFEDEVTLTYTKGADPIRDTMGNAAADLHNETVTNETLLGTTNTLTALSLEDVKLAPVFDSTYPNYAATMPNEITQTTVAAVTTDPRAKFRITPGDGDEKAAGHQVTLHVGNTTITVVVTPEDFNAAAGAYTITVTRLPDTTPPTLVSATVDGTMLTLDYDKPLERDSQLEAGDFTVNVADSDTGEMSSPTVSGVAVVDTTVILTLAPAVRYQDRVTIVYTPGNSPIRDIAGNKAGEISGRLIANSTPRSTMNTLGMLAIDGTVITLYDDTLGYAFAVDNRTEQATITATASDPRSTVSIIPPDADGKEANGHQVILKVGETPITITVTPEDANAPQSNYVITTTRLPDIIAPTLDTATVGGPALTLTYDEPLDEKSTPEAGDFSVEVVDSGTWRISSPQVSNVAISDAEVTLTLGREVRHRDKVTLDYTPGSIPIRDRSGNQSEEITTQSIDNDTPRSGANTLSALFLRGVVLTPEFAPGETSYSAAVASDISHIDVIARADDPRATVTISPGDSDTGDDGHRARLVPGRNEITVVVIPEDVTAARGRYTIAVHRALPVPVAVPIPVIAPVAKPSLLISATPRPQPAPAQVHTPAPTFLLMPSPAPTLTPRPTPTSTPRPTPTSTPTPAPTGTPTPTPTPTPTGTPTPTPTGTPTPTSTPTPVPTGTPVPALKPAHSLSPAPTASPIPLATQTPTPVPTTTLQRDTRLAAGPVERPTTVWGMMPIPTPVEAPRQPAFTPTVAPTRPPVSGEWAEWKGQSGVSTPASEPTPLPFGDGALPDQPANGFSPDGPGWLVILALSGLMARGIYQRFPEAGLSVFGSRIGLRGRNRTRGPGA